MMHAMDILLCQEDGTVTGTADKLQAHTDKVALHHAFSVFVFSNDKTQLLIQQRAAAKLLFAGFWANTCCSHPTNTTQMVTQAETRLMEECGFSCPLTAGDSFVYKADDPSGNGTEWEYDTVLIGTYEPDAELNPNPEEVAKLRWIQVEELKRTILAQPEQFAPWFHLALPLAIKSKEV